jgi:hypothetical protein
MADPQVGTKQQGNALPSDLSTARKSQPGQQHGYPEVRPANRLRVSRVVLERRPEYPPEFAQKNSLFPTPKSQCQSGLKGGPRKGWKATLGPSPQQTEEDKAPRKSGSCPDSLTQPPHLIPCG